ncbi:MAG TPA: hypothetical protein V6D12_12765 [Candidatus Obscuribacterales bacterium]
MLLRGTPLSKGAGGLENIAGVRSQESGVRSQESGVLPILVTGA